jgi:UDP-N-acetylmuramate dehydrogenase
MVELQYTYEASLKPFNTFGFDVQASSLYRIANVQQLDQLRIQTGWFTAGDFLTLGGGSNILLTQDVVKPVLKMDIAGIRMEEDRESHCVVVAGAGEIWHDLVLWCIHRDLGGLENLSLIPGQVGAAPMQNIGAYGVEIKDCFAWLKAYHIQTGEVVTFDGPACKFGYRESVFKRELKGQYIILEVAFRLTKKNHRLAVGYGAIQHELSQSGVSHPGIREVSDAVIRIRKSKLPDPKELGNSGSFFKNPEVPETLWLQIREKYTDVVGYPTSPGYVKLAAGWLIEKCGLKGYRDGHVGVHQKQALVLVHYGGGKGIEILLLAQKVQKAVQETFGVSLEPEVNIL